jgi:hypothetical protein
MDKDQRQCRKCDVSWGIAGLVFGLAITAIAVDLISGGVITRLVSRPARHLAAVTYLEVSDDDAG